jgi:thymidylate synthase
LFGSPHFKLHKDRTVSLTAIYRSQYYIAKALGNFIGLGQLLAFVAEEAGLTPGYLVCFGALRK